MGTFLKGCTCKLSFAIAAAAVGGGFQHGYNTGVINNPQTILEGWIRDTLGNRSSVVPPDRTVRLIWSTIVAIYCFGGILGGLLTGVISNNLGRKGGLLWNNLLVAFATGCFFLPKITHSFELLIIARFLSGVNSALNSGLAPMYLSEVSPVNLRGAIASIYQLVITISILVAQIMSIRAILGTERFWPLLFALTVVPAIFQIITLPFCPESPKYTLAAKGNEEKTRKAFVWLRDKEDVSAEMNEAKFESESAKNRATLKEIFTRKSLRSPLIISLMMMVAQQFSGINCVIYFSTEIFEMAGIKSTDATYATVGIGIINVLMTIIAVGLVETAGRKTLLLIGFGGMAIVTTLLFLGILFLDKASFFSYLCIVFVFIYIILFASGPGAIPWFLVSELFNQNARPIATSLAVCMNWLCNTIVGLTFLPIKDIIGEYVFLIFVAMQVAFFVFILFFVPETKNKTIEEITALFKD